VEMIRTVKTNLVCQNTQEWVNIQRIHLESFEKPQLGGGHPIDMHLEIDKLKDTAIKIKPGDIVRMFLEFDEEMF
jgi:hypothetical protein